MEMIHHWRWTTARYAVRVGWPGTLGAALLALAALSIPLHFWPDARANQKLADETEALRGTTASGHALADADSPDAQLRSFREILPGIRDIPTVLSTLHAAALKRGINLSEGQLKLKTDSGSDISRYEMVFPIKAAYGPTRDFVRDAMREVPALALDEIRFERTDPGSATLDTRVAFALYLLTVEGGRP